MNILKLNTILVFLFITSISYTIDSQIVVDTGDGTDGNFHATSNTTLPGGEYNFNDFIIDAGVIVSVTGDDVLIIRAQGMVSIQGELDLSGGDGFDGTGNNGTAGPGGQGVSGGGDGGNGGDDLKTVSIDGVDGEGPGGGTGGVTTDGTVVDFEFVVGGAGGGYGTAGQDPPSAVNDPNMGSFPGGMPYGNAELTQLLGGSGGGGGGGMDDDGISGNGDGGDDPGGGGGAGGGAVKIISNSISIGPTGVINADGGDGGACFNGGSGGGGSGGAIWLQAFDITHQGMISAVGGISPPALQPNVTNAFGGIGGEGRIRVDANNFDDQGTITPAVGFMESVQAIPTMGQWGIIICGILLLIIGVLSMSMYSKYTLVPAN